MISKFGEQKTRGDETPSQVGDCADHNEIPTLLAGIHSFEPIIC